MAKKTFEGTIDQAELIEMYSKARSNLVNYRHILLDTGPDECQAAPFHYRWSDLLLNGKGNIAIEGFRESAKTQYVLRAFLLYCLTYPDPKRSYIVLIKNNSTLAEDKLKEIEREFLANPLIHSNLVRINEQSGQCFSVDVEGEGGCIVNMRIEAYGKGASIRGLAYIDRRPNLVLIDDPQDLEDAKSDTVQEGDWQWFLGDVKFLGQYTRIFLIGNNLGERCIIERAFNNPKELNFSTEKVPIEQEGIPTWPAKYRINDILKEKQDFRTLGQEDVWMRERMCECAAEESRVFHKKDFCYYAHTTTHKIADDCNIFFTIDPASSTEPGACLRAICVLGVNPKNYWFVLDFPHGKWDSTTLMDILFDKVRQWNPMKVGIEKGMYKQVIEPFIQEEMVKRNCFFEIVPIEHAKVGSKLERVKMLGPRFKAGSVWLPQQASWLGELETELFGVTKDGFKSLYSDMVDAFAMQEQIAQAPIQASGSPYLGVGGYGKSELPRTGAE